MHRRRASSTQLALFLTVITCSVVACHRPRVDPIPRNAHQFTAPPIYQRWWAMTAECSGASAPIADVKWFVVPGVSLFWREGSVINGFWSRTDNAIVLAEGAVDDGAVVRHEMLHAMQHEGRHLRRDFVERCGGVVSCLSACLEAAGGGPAPDATLPVVRPESMSIDVAVDPPSLERSADGRFTVTVSVRNPAMDSVVVAFSDAPGEATSAFRFELMGGAFGMANGIPWRGPGPMVFGPGEVRRAVFDLRISAGSGADVQVVPPGFYEIRGGFGRAWSPVRALAVGQE